MIELIKKKFIDVKFMCFILIGIINTINHNIIYLLLLKKIPYFWSNSLSFLFSMIISFFLNSKFTFKVKPTVLKFLKFPLSYLPNFFCQMIGIVFLVEFIQIKETYAAFGASLLAIPVTYLLMQIILKD